MQTEWFHSFVETIRMGSLSKAGEKLNISQTALSKQIKNLEESFEVELFLRTTAGMDITPEGQLLYEKVQIWLKDMDDTKRQMKNLKSMKQVVIGCLPSLSSYYLPEKILHLKSDGVRVDIRIFDTSKDVLDAFIAGNVDIAIFDRAVNIPKIHPVADLFAEPYYAVVPHSHTLSGRSHVGVEDIAQEPFVLYPQKCDIRRSLDKVVSRTGGTLLVAEEIPFGEAILGFVAAGAGITIVPEMIANHLGNAKLTTIPITDFGIERTIGWVAKSPEQFQFFRKYFKQSRK